MPDHIHLLAHFPPDRDMVAVIADFKRYLSTAHQANSGKCRAGYPQNVAEARLYCVTVEGLEGSVRLEGLDGYGTGDIFADADGKIYLWLPNGNYSFKANDEPYTVTVADGATTATTQ